MTDRGGEEGRGRREGRRRREGSAGTRVKCETHTGVMEVRCFSAKHSRC